ncbi:TonB-dependent siderophore receptor [Aliikangiella sp. G2MR2-5]|uniref:TonB-dependent receptor plug domain-containing protein n=1 Tax=Aliikangiella sp. G2MR2-5 TaxID=2788943 RepID=UPI0018A8CB52|nr:TonB-dependent receptor [Aliikangiella sp. G2MR2-5]
MLQCLHRYSPAIFLAAYLAAPAVNGRDIDVNKLSLQELLNLKVVSASKREQSLDESPALVEIITQSDLQRRGYKDLSHLLDDLAGIQISRAYSDNYFNTFWRGIRHTIGSSHLILVDGIRFNHLYTNESEVMAAMPISNIRHIEIVYGPASVAYGSDAVAGIINIITYTPNERARSEANAQGFLQIGKQDTKVIDASFFKRFREWDLSLTARTDRGDLDFSHTDEYRWTQRSLLENPDIWGGFSPEYTQLSSPHNNRALDIRLSTSKNQFILQLYELSSGYGLKYTFDHSLPDAGQWIEQDFSFVWRWQEQLSNNLKVKTDLRLRESNFDKDSFFIEGYLVQDPESGANIRLLDASYWSSKNNSTSFNLEVDWLASEKWHFLGGIEHEAKDLQKAYNTDFGPSLPPADVTADYSFPAPPTIDTVANNRIDTSQSSLYGLVEYEVADEQSLLAQKLHFGMRNVHDSEYESETTIRAGYVGRLKNTTFKLFYGEAYQEPSPRLLYGGWKGSGSNPTLEPRNAKTWEFNINYKLETLLVSANIFQMDSANLFNTTDSGAINAGEAKSKGGDLRVRYRPNIDWSDNITFWASYAWIDAKEQTFDDSGALAWFPVGDLADTTLHFGSYLTFNEHWQLSLRGRYYGERATVETNPLDKIDAFSVLDLNLNYQPQNSQFNYQLNITNLFNKTYFHPGLRSAGASDTNPGEVDGNGIWIGSENFYNAKIAQPGRNIDLSIYWQF